MTTANRVPRPTLAELRVLRDHPHEFIRDLDSRHGPISAFGKGPLRGFLLSHPDHVKHVLLTAADRYDKNTFQYRLLAHITGDGLLTMDGAPWRQRRRLEQPAFHLSRIAEFVPLMHAATERMVDRWDGHARSGEPIDVMAEMLHVALQIVVRALFGVDVGGRADGMATATMTMLHYIMHRARTLGMVPWWLPTRRQRAFKRAMALLDEQIYGTIARRRAAGQTVDPQTGIPDLMARLLGAAPSEGLSDRQLRDEMITMIIAGHETVASALAWTWHLVAHDPEVDRKLADEAGAVLGDRAPGVDDLPNLTFHTCVFQEALRLYPPAWIITRKAVVEDHIGATVIPRRSLVVLSPYVTQRHTRWWTDPDTFRPERFHPDAVAERPRHAYFPFGGGPHICIGNHFSMVEAAVVMAGVVRRFRLEALSDGPVAVDPGVTLQPRGGLPMRVRPR